MLAILLIVTMISLSRESVGMNCQFDPTQAVDIIKIMKKGLDDAGFNKTYLITQPLGFMVPDTAPDGYCSLPDFPFGKVRLFHKESIHLGAEGLALFILEPVVWRPIIVTEH